MFLLPMLLVIAVLNFWIFVKKRSNTKFAFADAVLRSPGESLARKINDLSFDFALYFSFVSLFPMLFYMVYQQAWISQLRPPSVTAGIFLFGAAFLVTVWVILKITSTIKQLHLYKIGYAGEVAVGNALNQLMLNGYRVFHDIEGDKQFNVDHLLVGPAGVFAVETKAKTKKKKIKGKQSHKVLFDGKSLFFPDKPESPHQAFLEQAKRNAKWVSRWLSEATGHPVKVQAVLVLPGWFIEIKKPGDVRVLNHNQVQALTDTANRPLLGKPEIDRIVYQVQQRCQNRKIVPQVLRKE